jgi:hypothetical protein
MQPINTGINGIIHCVCGYGMSEQIGQFAG